MFTGVGAGKRFAHDSGASVTTDGATSKAAADGTAAHALFCNIMRTTAATLGQLPEQQSQQSEHFAKAFDAAYEKHVKDDQAGGKMNATVRDFSSVFKTLVKQDAIGIGPTGRIRCEWIIRHRELAGTLDLIAEYFDESTQQWKVRLVDYKTTSDVEIMQEPLVRWKYYNAAVWQLRLIAYILRCEHKIIVDDAVIVLLSRKAHHVFRFGPNDLQQPDVISKIEVKMKQLEQAKLLRTVVDGDDGEKLMAEVFASRLRIRPADAGSAEKEAKDDSDGASEDTSDAPTDADRGGDEDEDAKAIRLLHQQEDRHAFLMLPNTTFYPKAVRETFKCLHKRMIFIRLKPKSLDEVKEVEKTYAKLDRGGWWAAIPGDWIEEIVVDSYGEHTSDCLKAGQSCMLPVRMHPFGTFWMYHNLLKFAAADVVAMWGNPEIPCGSCEVSPSNVHVSIS